MFDAIEVRKGFFLSLSSFATSLGSASNTLEHSCSSIRGIKYRYRSIRSERIESFSRVLMIVDRCGCGGDGEKKEMFAGGPY